MRGYDISHYHYPTSFTIIQLTIGIHIHEGSPSIKLQGINTQVRLIFYNFENN